MVVTDTNLCYSQSEVRKRMIDAIVNHCEENSNIDMLHFWLADGTNNHCECEDHECHCEDHHEDKHPKFFDKKKYKEDKKKYKEEKHKYKEII